MHIAKYVGKGGIAYFCPFLTLSFIIGGRSYSRSQWDLEEEQAEERWWKPEGLAVEFEVPLEDPIEDCW